MKEGDAPCCSGGVCTPPALQDKITPEDYTPQSATKEQPLPKLLDLGAGKCIPCKMMAPILDEMKETFAGSLDVEFIDVWENPDAAKPHNVRIIPTQIFYNAEGKELFRHEGFFARDEMLAKWKEFGFEFQEIAE